MKRVESVYLAGPDPWFPEADAHRRRQEALCVAAGLAPISSRLGAGAGEAERTEVHARILYTEALSDLRRADALIANLSPWRGPSCDPATAFLAGFAAALGKPVFAYSNISDEEEADPRGRVEAWMGASPDLDGRLRDGAGAEIEDFYLPETLMLWAETRRFFAIITEDPFHDLTGLEMCLDALQLYAE